MAIDQILKQIKYLDSLPLELQNLLYGNEASVGARQLLKELKVGLDDVEIILPLLWAVLRKDEKADDFINKVYTQTGMREDYARQVCIKLAQKYFTSHFTALSFDPKIVDSWKSKPLPPKKTGVATSSAKPTVGQDVSSIRPRITPPPLAGRPAVPRAAGAVRVSQTADAGVSELQKKKTRFLSKLNMARRQNISPLAREKLGIIEKAVALLPAQRVDEAIPLADQLAAAVIKQG